MCAPRRRPGGAFLTALALAAAVIPVARGAGAAQPADGKKAPARLVVPVRIRVAQCEGEPVRDRPWLEAHVAAANAVFAPHGIELQPRFETFAPRRCTLLTRRHRHAMARHVARDSSWPPTVLVVRRVRDVDVPSYDLQGVHWRYRGPSKRHAGKRWVFLTARGEHPVLAHELGHFFGLSHDPAGGNLMTPGASSPAWKSDSPPAPFRPILTEAQAAAVRARIEAAIEAAGPTSEGDGGGE